MADKKVKMGPFKNALYSGAEIELELDALLRYRTKDDYAKVADFFRNQYGDLGGSVQVLEQAQDGRPSLYVAVGPKYTDVDFSVIVVMADPAAAAKGKTDLWILVTARE